MPDTDREVLISLAKLAGDSLDDLAAARRRTEAARVRLLELEGLVATGRAELAAAELAERQARAWAQNHWPMFRGELERCGADARAALTSSS